MTAPAVLERPPPAPVVVPAVASLAIRSVVTGPVRTAAVLGVSSHAAWLGIGSDVVVLTSRDATRLPNSLEIPLTADAARMHRAADEASARIGAGALSIGDRTVTAARWWDPRPVLRSTDPADIRHRIAGLTRGGPALPVDEIKRALGSGDAGAFLAACGSVIGRGEGLTPEGDDVVAGTVVGLRCIGRSLGRSVATLEAIGPPLAALAHARTTTFSAALIRHAIEGEVARPAAAFLHALTGRGDPDLTYRRLLAVGHTSGAALAAGVLLAADALIEGDDT